MQELVELARRVQEISDSGDVGRALEGVAARLSRLASETYGDVRVIAVQPSINYADMRMIQGSELDLILDRLRVAQKKAEAYDRINTPEVDNFLSAVRNEALHQRERWGADQDGGKADADWFWLVGYLAGKALHNVNGKRLHHVITAAAALLNWHAALTGQYARMRPGSDPEKVS